MTDTTREERWIYAGKRYSDGKLYHVMVEENDGETEHWFAKPPARRYSAVGSIYKVHVTGTGDGIKLHTGGERAPVYVDRLPLDDVWTREWSARDAAAEVRARIDKDARNAAQQNAFRALVAPLKREFRKLNYTGQSAMIAAIITELHRYERDADADAAD